MMMVVNVSFLISSRISDLCCSLSLTQVCFCLADV